MVLQKKIEEHFGTDLRDKLISIWGLSFKPQTDDIREAPSLVLIRRLLELGAKIRVHDPEAMRNVKSEFGEQLTYCHRMMDVADQADALAICTEWQDYRTPDFLELKDRMKQPTIFDGRNLYDCNKMAELGFNYYSIGRPVVRQEV